jgi:hypothetical protein
MEAPGQVDTIVVIASPTRGFALPPADMPPVIRAYPATPQDQDEKGSLILGEAPTEQGESSPYCHSG